MNLERTNFGSGAGLGFIMASVIFAALAIGVKLSQPTPGFDADRGDLRAKALVEMRATEEKALVTPAIIDPGHGTVRLPIDAAMQMAAQAWKNPAAARADLNARAETATKELPKTPPKPSAFE